MNVSVFTKIIVIGGFDGSSYLSNVELVDLENDKKRCPSLPEYPLAVNRLTAAFYQGKVVACGGYDGTTRTDKCYELGPDLRQWFEFLPFPDNPDDDKRSSIIDDKWIVSGGSVHPSSLYSFDGRFTIENPMPFLKESHCQVTINSTHIFFTSGVGNDGAATFMLNWNIGEWIFLDDVSLVPDTPTCGLINSKSYGLEIILASDTRSFIFSLTDLVWKDGPLPPENLDFITTAQLTDGILAIGGRDPDDVYVDTIYKFDEDVYDWVLEKERLANPRGFAAAVAVPDSFLACE